MGKTFFLLFFVFLPINGFWGALLSSGKAAIGAAKPLVKPVIQVVPEVVPIVKPGVGAAGTIGSVTKTGSQVAMKVKETVKGAAKLTDNVIDASKPLLPSGQRIKLPASKIAIEAEPVLDIAKPAQLTPENVLGRPQAVDKPIFKGDRSVWPRKPEGMRPTVIPAPDPAPAVHVHSHAANRNARTYPELTGSRIEEPLRRLGSITAATNAPYILRKHDAPDKLPGEGPPTTTTRTTTTTQEPQVASQTSGIQSAPTAITPLRSSLEPQLNEAEDLDPTVPVSVTEPAEYDVYKVIAVLIMVAALLVSLYLFVCSLACVKNRCRFYEF